MIDKDIPNEEVEEYPDEPQTMGSGMDDEDDGDDAITNLN